MLATLTGLGLSAAVGLNAYIPFLLVALVARFTDFVTLPTELSWIASPWAIAIAAILCFADFFIDKVPALDSVNDAISTVIRPATGGLIFAASTAAEDFEEHSALMTQNPWIGIVLGVVVALTVHSGKTISRPVLNTSTGGLAAPVASGAEEGFSLAMSLTAIFVPILVIFFLIIIVIGLIFIAHQTRKFLSKRRQRKGNSANQPAGTLTEPPHNCNNRSKNLAPS